MKKLSIKYMFLLLTFSLISCDENSPKKDIDPFSYAGNFENTELVIDGIKDEKQWEDNEYCTPEYNFKYKSEANGNYYNYSIQIYRGLKELYVFFNVEDCNLVTYGNDNGSNVTYSDSCEIYFNPKLDKETSPQSDDLQYNLGVHNRTRVAIGNGSGWSTSSGGIILYEVAVDGTINDETDVDKGYTLEMCVSYKQLGITRNSDIGITFGIVDRFGTMGTITSKKWYGATIDGHFGSPQNPSSYFILKKNKLELPPIDEYVAENDNTEYINNHQLVIPDTTVDSLAYQEIKLKTSRVNNIVTILATTEQIWQKHHGLFISFDFGDYSRTQRDENTYCLRVYPGNKSIKDFYKYPNIGMNQNSLTIRMDDNNVYISLDISKLLPKFVGNVNIAAASIELSKQIIVSQLKIDDRSINQTNISTYFQLTDQNTIIDYVDPFEYITNNDTTNYSLDFEAFTPKVSYNDNEFGKIIYKVNRNNNIITLLATSETNWHENELLIFGFDLGANDKTARDEKTIYLRFYPSTGSIKDFFSYPNTGIDKTSVNIKKSKNQVQVTINFSSIISNMADYVENGIALNVAILHKEGLKVLKYATINNNEQTLNVTTWPRINLDNTTNKNETDLNTEITNFLLKKSFERTSLYIDLSNLQFFDKNYIKY